LCLILHNVPAVSLTPFSQGVVTSDSQSMLPSAKLSHFCCCRSRTNRLATPSLRWQKSGMLKGTDSFCVIAGRRQDRKYLNIADFAPDDNAASMCRAALQRAIAIEIQILATAVEILTGALSFLLEVIKDPSFENISEEFYSTLNNIFAGSIADLVSGIVESLVSVWSINTPAPFGDPPVRRGGGAPGRQYGGNVRRGMPYVVGEKRAEVFVPPVSGKIFPSLENFQRAMSPVPAVAPAPMNIDRSTHLEINPTYRNVQSEASIRHDALALLASVWR